MWAGLNRRKFPRAQYQCKIVIKKKLGAPISAMTLTENIGIGGICVVLEKDLHMFRNVNVELFLGTEDKPINCTGTIVWVVKRTDAQKHSCYDTGIEFLKIKEGDKERISTVVDEILAKEDFGKK